MKTLTTSSFLAPFTLGLVLKYTISFLPPISLSVFTTLFDIQGVFILKLEQTKSTNSDNVSSRTSFLLPYYPLLLFLSFNCISIISLILDYLYCIYSQVKCILKFEFHIISHALPRIAQTLFSTRSRQRSHRLCSPNFR